MTQCTRDTNTCSPPSQTCDDCGSSEDVCQGECSFNPIDSTCRPQFSNNVRTASVHLSYTLPSTVSEPSWWLQRIEPVSSSSATYFCGVGNSYGYGGIQQVDGDSTSDPPNGKVIFSIWDGGCDQDQVRFMARVAKQQFVRHATRLLT